MRPDEYAVDFDGADAESVMGKELSVGEIGTDERVAGAWARSLFESGSETADDRVAIGYRADRDRGAKAVTIGCGESARPTAIFGEGGTGKSALLGNVAVQLAHRGRGFCLIDMNGNGAPELVRRLPEDRLDDLVCIDATGRHNEDRVAGLNFLRASIDREDERAFDKEVEAIVDDMRSIIRDESYWGSRMNVIFNTICRAMVRSEKPYTLVDMYYVLLDEEYREYFVEDIDDGVVPRCARMIADDMDQEDLDPLLRRLKKIVESPDTREVTAHRDARTDLGSCIEDGKIVAIRADAADWDGRRIIAQMIAKKLSAAARTRGRSDGTGDAPPYHVLGHGIDSMDEIGRMFAREREMGLRPIMTARSPTQLSEKAGVGIFAECETLLSMRVAGVDELLIPFLGEMEIDSLHELDEFEMVVERATGDGGDRRVVQTFAPYPPVRGMAEAEEAIDASLDRYGSPRADPDKIFGDTIIGRAEYDMDHESIIEDAVDGGGGDGNGNDNGTSEDGGNS